jgi:glutamine synthetase
MATLDTAVYHSYMSMDQGPRIQAEYIWLGGSGSDIRSKTKTLESKVKSPDELPIWNFDGSSTGQAPGSDSEVYLKPVAIYPDPFRGGNNILVVCECYTPAMKPLPSNTRYSCNKAMEAAKAHLPWFGIEQEYTLFEKDGHTPLGWPKDGFPSPQGPYYCMLLYINMYAILVARWRRYTFSLWTVHMRVALSCVPSSWVDDIRY